MDLWKRLCDCMCVEYNRGLVRVCTRDRQELGKWLLDEH
jgi:hypothetical protein